jgi:hypothetical protein
MKKQEIILILALLLYSLTTFSQGFLITPPKLDFDGNQLLISYDVINKNASDQFYVWVEMEKKSGEPIQIKALSGDVGENVKSGLNKKITWVPSKDNIFLDEEINVEVKAEKYVKSFNKGSALLMSTAFPGLGQTKISNGKPWWITGIIAYGALAGGLVTHASYLKSYDSYRSETNPSKRSDLLAQTQKQMNLSNALIISGATLWAANILWVAITPDRYQPLQNVKLTLEQSTRPFKGTTLLSLKVNF